MISEGSQPGLVGHTLQPLARISTPFKQKFAIPRQPRLVAEAKGEIRLLPGFDQPETVRGLTEFSHLWLLFLFHQNLDKGWRPLVRPPRLGGNERLGVFATRSTFRPNGIGMSAVQLDGIEHRDGKPVILVSGVDLLDGTPLVDIKPYLPYSDAIPDAVGGFADQSPDAGIEVDFSDCAQQQLQQAEQNHPDLGALIAKLLRQDPRPAYHKRTQSRDNYGVALYQYNIKWTVEGNRALVTEIDPF